MVPQPNCWLNYSVAVVEELLEGLPNRISGWTDSLQAFGLLSAAPVAEHYSGEGYVLIKRMTEKSA